MAAHNSTHTGKQILLSRKEFPSWIEERESDSQNGHQVSDLSISLTGFSFKPESSAGNTAICAHFFY